MQFTSSQFYWNWCYVSHKSADISPTPIRVWKQPPNPERLQFSAPNERNGWNGAKQVISQATRLQITTFLGLTILRPKRQISTGTANTENKCKTMVSSFVQCFQWQGFEFDWFELWRLCSVQFKDFSISWERLFTNSSRGLPCRLIINGNSYFIGFFRYPICNSLHF